MAEEPQDQNPNPNPEKKVNFNFKIFLVFFIVFTFILGAPSFGAGVYGLILSLTHGLNPSYGGTTVDCTSAEVFQKHPEYRSLVADAASRYLSGDQAILIGLIQAESNWDKDNRNPTSSATGFGQFLDKTNPTENGKPFFNLISPDGVNPNDDRRNPVIAIPATAFYFKQGIDKSKADPRPENSKIMLYHNAYIWYYHTGGKDSKGATDGAKNMLNSYNSMLENGECRQNSFGGGNYIPGSGGWHWVLNKEVQETNPRYSHSCFKPWARIGGNSKPYCAADYGQFEGGGSGSLVYAITDGTITFLTYSDHADPYLYQTKGYNADFISDDGQVDAIYAHIYRGGITSNADLSQPIRVRGGDPFATVYNGASPHLHFELYVQGIGLVIDSEQLNVYRQLSQSNR